MYGPFLLIPILDFNILGVSESLSHSPRIGNRGASLETL